MIERNVYMPDVQKVLTTGTVNRFKQTEMTQIVSFVCMEQNVEGEDLVLVVKILDTENRLELISVFLGRL